MPEHQETVDAFTDIPQAEAMRPAAKSDDTDAGDTPTDDLTVQGGE